MMQDTPPGREPGSNFLDHVTRRFSDAHGNPYDCVTWGTRPVTDPATGKSSILEFPTSWDQVGCQIVAAKYFRIIHGVRETSLRQVVGRIAETVTDHGVRAQYFATDDESIVFHDELVVMMLTRRVAFNSPVWFNVGVTNTPQISACMPYETRVNTDIGMVPIGEIVHRLNIGETIHTFDRDGVPTRIVAGICNGRRPVFEFSLKDGSSISMTADHVVFVRDGDTMVTKLASELVPNVDKLVFTRNELLPRDGALMSTIPYTGYEERVAWLAGTMVGNGFSGRPPSATSDTWEIKFASHTCTDEAESILTDLGISYKRSEFLWGSMVRGYGAAAKAFWSSLDLWDRTNDKHLPEWVFRAPAGVVTAFVRGLLDTDGTVTCQPGERVYVQLSNTSEQVVRSTQTLLRALGIFSTVNSFQDRRTDSKRKPCFTMTVMDVNSVAKFADVVGFTHHEKRERLSATRHNVACAKRCEVEVVAKKHVGQTYVYDIQTEASCFWAEGILVHNCFITPIDDNMTSILDHAALQGRIYQGGSGNGTNYSRLRASRERLSTGGTSSGPVPFIAAHDANGGSIKSGGSTRRSAAMVVLDVDHPDIEDFVDSKIDAENAAHALVAAGWSPDFTDDKSAYAMVGFQNANHSVRVTDEFMRRATGEHADSTWTLRDRTGPGTTTTDARALLERIATAAHGCGDPGLQFDNSIQSWHTCPESGRIHASNPCCFVGETLVETSEGRIRIDELARMSESGDELPFAYAWDERENLPILRRIKKAWKSGEAARLVRVVTDKGVELLCTPEHPFLLRDGNWVDAKNLENGMRLRKIGRWANQQRSGRWHLNHRATAKAPNGTSIQARWMWEHVFGDIPTGMDVHHKNCDPTDDRASNLELVDAYEHRSEHSVGERNPRFMVCPAPVLVEVYEAIEEIPRRTHKARPMVTPARWNAYVKRMGLKIPQACSSSNGGRIQGMSWTQFVDFIEEHRDDVNDCVVSCEFIETPKALKWSTSGELQTVPVYDLEVDDVHNFSVAHPDAPHGIVVHNSEFLFLDNTSCDLASLHLSAFFGEGFGPDAVNDFVAAVETTVLALEILCDLGAYPSPEITELTRATRPLGIGFTGLGALLMGHGIPYDSVYGRQLAAAITALMTGAAYRRSADMAAAYGPFAEFERNQNPMLDVVTKHAEQCEHLSADTVLMSRWPDLVLRAGLMWKLALVTGRRHGYRNAQLSVIAPAGTISFALGSESFSVEPVAAMATVKALVGGGQVMSEPLDCVRRGVRAVLARREDLGTVYGGREQELIDLVVAGETSVLGPDAHVFATAYGRFPISWRGHVAMMAAIQPFLSGAISKTISFSADSSPDDILECYTESWRMGLKAVAVYRDGCKASQPLTSLDRDTSTTDVSAPEPGINHLTTTSATAVQPRATRIKLPTTRQSVTHKFSVGGHEGYVTVGLYEDGQPGEIFVRMAKEGSAISGLMDVWATAVSIALQHGCPLETLVDKFRGHQFEPSGFTGDPDIGYASSIPDYLFQWIDLHFGEGAPEPSVKPDGSPRGRGRGAQSPSGHGPLCTGCGGLTTRSGTCWTCGTCGSTSGGCA